MWLPSQWLVFLPGVDRLMGSAGRASDQKVEGCLPSAAYGLVRGPPPPRPRPRVGALLELS